MKIFGVIWGVGANFSRETPHKKTLGNPGTGFYLRYLIY